MNRSLRTRLSIIVALLSFSAFKSAEAGAPVNSQPQGEILRGGARGAAAGAALGAIAGDAGKGAAIGAAAGGMKKGFERRDRNKASQNAGPTYQQQGTNYNSQPPW